MDVEIFLCEEHHEKLKISGPVKGSSRVWGSGSTGLCFVFRCMQDIAWSVKVRLPERKSDLKWSN